MQHITINCQAMVGILRAGGAGPARAAEAAEASDVLCRGGGDGKFEEDC